MVLCPEPAQSARLASTPECRQHLTGEQLDPGGAREVGEAEVEVAEGAIGMALEPGEATKELEAGTRKRQALSQWSRYSGGATDSFTTKYKLVATAA